MACLLSHQLTLFPGQGAYAFLFFFYVISVYKLYLQTWHGEEAHAECICILLVAGEWL